MLTECLPTETASSSDRLSALTMLAEGKSNEIKYAVSSDLIDRGLAALTGDLREGTYAIEITPSGNDLLHSSTS